MESWKVGFRSGVFCGFKTWIKLLIVDVFSVVEKEEASLLKR